MVCLASLGGVLEFGGNNWGYINVSTVLRVLRREGDKDSEKRAERGAGRQLLTSVNPKSSTRKQMHSSDDLYTIMSLYTKQI